VWPVVLLAVLVPPAGGAPAPLKKPVKPEQRIEAILDQLGDDGMADIPELSGRLYLRKVSGRTLWGVVFKQRNAKGEVVLICSAERCDFRFDPRNNRLIIRLHNGFFRSGDTTTWFADRTLALPWPAGAGAR
jgi:hypothetical protein